MIASPTAASAAATVMTKNTKTWPADAKCYSKDFQYFVVTDSGTRAWFMRIRM